MMDNGFFAWLEVLGVGVLWVWYTYRLLAHFAHRDFSSWIIAILWAPVVCGLFLGQFARDTLPCGWGILGVVLIWVVSMGAALGATWWPLGFAVAVGLFVWGVLFAVAFVARFWDTTPLAGAS